jgi:hypothetical protein
MAEETEFSEIQREECLELLAAQSVGRLAVIRKGRPLIFPVNYVLDGDVIVFRTDPGAKLSGAPLRKVAFEIDGVDETAGTGWSVLVQGYCYEITNGIDAHSEFRRTLPVTPFAPGDKRHWVEIMPEVITGRRVSPKLSSPR